MESLIDIVERLKRHDDQEEIAFQALYEQTKRTALAVIRRYCDNKADYDDILQETYISVFKNIDSLQDNAKVQAWVNRIAANTAIRQNMKKYPVMFSEMEDENGNIPDFEDDSHEYNPEVIADKHAVSEIIVEILSSLPEDQRAALWMVYGQQVTIKEMAQSLGISENTIKSRLHQGKNKLLARKDDFRKHGIEITAIPVAALIALAFQDTVYAANGGAEFAAAKELAEEKGASKPGASPVDEGTSPEAESAPEGSIANDEPTAGGNSGANRETGWESGTDMAGEAALGEGSAIAGDSTAKAGNSVAEELSVAGEPTAEAGNSVAGEPSAAGEAFGDESAAAKTSAAKASAARTAAAKTTAAKTAEIITKIGQLSLGVKAAVIGVGVIAIIGGSVALAGGPSYMEPVEEKISAYNNRSYGMAATMDVFYPDEVSDRVERLLKNGGKSYDEFLLPQWENSTSYLNTFFVADKSRFDSQYGEDWKITYKKKSVKKLSGDELEKIRKAYENPMTIYGKSDLPSIYSIHLDEKKELEKWFSRQSVSKAYHVILQMNIKGYKGQGENESEAILVKYGGNWLLYPKNPDDLVYTISFHTAGTGKGKEAEGTDAIEAYADVTPPESGEPGLEKSELEKTEPEGLEPEETEPEEPEDPYDNEINRKMMLYSKDLLETKKEDFPEGSLFGVCDVNQDGIYEVYVYAPGKSSAEEAAYLMYYKKSERTFYCAEILNGSFSYILETGQIICTKAQMGYHTEIYEIDDNGVRITDSFSYYDKEDPSYEDNPEESDNNNKKLEDLNDNSISIELVESTPENRDYYLSGTGTSARIADYAGYHPFNEKAEPEEESTANDSGADAGERYKSYLGTYQISYLMGEEGREEPGFRSQYYVFEDRGTLCFAYTEDGGGDTFVYRGEGFYEDGTDWFRCIYGDEYWERTDFSFEDGMLLEYYFDTPYTVYYEKID